MKISNKRKLRFIAEKDGWNGDKSSRYNPNES